MAEDVTVEAAAVVDAARRLLALVDHRDGSSGSVAAGPVRLELRTGAVTCGTRHCCTLSPMQATVYRVLLERAGQVVTRQELLSAAGYHGGPDTTRRVDAVVYRLHRLGRKLPGTLTGERCAGYRWEPPRG